MITNQDFVVVNLTPWDFEFGNNCCNIAIELAKHNRVLYVNPPLDRITAMREKDQPKIRKRLDILAGKKDDLVKLSDNLWNLYPKTLIESINWVPNRFAFDFVNRINNRRLAKAIADAMKRLDFKQPIMFNDNDIFRCYHLKEMLNPQVYIYYIRDQLIAVDYWKRHGIRLEPKHMAKADAIVANSVHLAEYAREFNPKSYYVGQGCDLGEWKPENVAELPRDVRTIPGPIIGYVGALDTNRLDISLISQIAQARPDWSIVLVGPEDETFKTSRLHEMRNVIFLGSKPPTELPAYVKAFDVCINPQAVNPVTIGNYPRKIDEYLAMGKPTVATRTKAMEVFKDYTYLASSPEEYVKMISWALEENSPQKAEGRQVFASQHTWENNTKEIYKVIKRQLVAGSGKDEVGNMKYGVK